MYAGQDVEANSMLRNRLALYLTLGILGLPTTGCGIKQAPAVAGETAAIRGNVHGGQQPVKGSTIQLWAAGTSSNTPTPTSLLNTTVQSDNNGSFSITGHYTCPSASSLIYL